MNSRTISENSQLHKKGDSEKSNNPEEVSKEDKDSSNSEPKEVSKEIQDASTKELDNSAEHPYIKSMVHASTSECRQSAVGILAFPSGCSYPTMPRTQPQRAH